MRVVAAAWYFSLLSLLLLVGPVAADTSPLLTVAEKSDFRATSRHADVVAFCEQLAKLSPLVRLDELGKSFEKRKLPLVILADPPIATPEAAVRSGKLVILIFANIHAGEVDGKEASMMLVRDLAVAKEHPLLKNLILVFAPIFNADGNERMSKTNRPGQVGPVEGMGIRANAQQYDLNRDFVKLESPEVQALVRFADRWKPAILVDMHTTDGSFHRYVITYETPRNPACDSQLVEMARDVMMPDIGRRLKKHGGWESFFYGNFSRDYKRWTTVPGTPRYGIHYFGFRGQIGILSESYSYATYKDRILAGRDFALSIIEYAADNADRLHSLLARVCDETIRAGRDPKPSDRVSLRMKTVPLNGTFNLLSYDEDDKPHEYPVQYFGLCEPTLSVRRPFAYLFQGHPKVIENLQRHGVQMEELQEDAELNVELYRTDKITRENRVFQKHKESTVEVTPRAQSWHVPAGTIVVRTGQPLGTLIAYLLEPQSEDGLCRWNFFDADLAEGKDYPVARLPAPTALKTRHVAR